MDKKVTINNKELETLKQAQMTYPTWEIVSDFLDITNSFDPSKEFGNSALVHDKCPKGAKSGKYPEQTALRGIDVPVLFTPLVTSKSKGIIIILGESPLRNDSDIIKNVNVIMGTPFAIHQKWDIPSQCNVYKMIFDGVLSMGYSIYITDIIKVWEKEKKLAFYETDIKLFKQELEKIKEMFPSKQPIIVTFGNKASAALGKLKESLHVISIKHPGRLNWNNWKLGIFEKAVYSEDVTYATKYYPSIDDKTSDEIVASEALIEIEAGIRSFK